MNYTNYVFILFFCFAYCHNLDITLQKRLNRIDQDLEFLKNQNMVLQKSLNLLNERCQLLSDDICGPCTCRDDDRVDNGYYCDCQMLQPKRDCLDFYNHGLRVNGVYKIHQNILKIIQVYCDHETDGGGWTVVQRRVDGSVNFFRDWKAYEKGFGQLQNEFWLGNKNLFTLTHQDLRIRGNELRIDMMNAKSIKKYAKYGKFQIGSPITNYRLFVAVHSGSATDYLAYNNGMPFSTFDHDNDELSGNNCAIDYHSGWWFKGCFNANLNGLFYSGGKRLFATGTGIHWGWATSFSHYDNLPLIFSEMKVRRKL